MEPADTTPAPSAPADGRLEPDRRWLRTARSLGLGLAVSVPVFVVFGLTIGLITGLVVLVGPLYVLGLQMGIAAVVVSLLLWRRKHGAAGVVGTVLVTVPELLLAGWYLNERLRCARAADPAACYAYLDGSVLLPIGVGVGLLTSLLACVVLWRTVGRARRAR